MVGRCDMVLSSPAFWDVERPSVARSAWSFGGKGRAATTMIERAAASMVAGRADPRGL